MANNKHEAFAYGLAKGMRKGDAYINAGYSHSPASATRLSNQPDVKARFEELREEMMAAASAIIEAPTEENAHRLSDLALTLDWCADQYKLIADEAREAGQYSAANAAVKNIQGIVEIKTAKGKKNTEDEEKFSIKQLKDLSEIMKSLPAPVEMVDITPRDPAEFKLPVLPQVEDADTE